MKSDAFADIIKSASALRCVRRLQPVGGQGDYVAPPTYLDENDKTTHVFETRHINNENIQCVLLDSVQSQANRLENALLNAVRTKDLKIPHVKVDFTKFESVKDIGIITSMDAPHRIFDAIIRDSVLDGEDFLKTGVGKQISAATVNNALSVFSHSPTTLIFGGWNSTGDLGGSGPRFQRCIVSEIVGINIAKSKKPSSRLDPLQIEKLDIFVSSKTNWGMEKIPDSKKKKPSEINHGNIAPSITELGITMDYALHTTVITLAGLRHLSFPDNSGKIDPQSNLAAWSALASLAMLAVFEQNGNGYSLRSRCDLTPEIPNSGFELIHNDGTVETLKITRDDALALFNESVASAKELGLTWDDEPLEAIPQNRLVALVEESRKNSLTKSG